MDREHLLNELRRQQAVLAESDRLFARRLGIARTAWNAIRLGRRGMSGPTIMAAFRAFPDLYERLTDAQDAQTKTGD